MQSLTTEHQQQKYRIQYSQNIGRHQTVADPRFARGQLEAPPYNGSCRAEPPAGFRDKAPGWESGSEAGQKLKESF